MDALGFVQSAEIPSVMNEAQCLVLPSRLENWGVVIQEAGVAGLPVITTDACGAVSMFVRDGINGYIDPVDRDYLAQAMVRMTELSRPKLEEMSAAGCRLARISDVRMVAEYFLDTVRIMIRSKRHHR